MAPARRGLREGGGVDDPAVNTPGLPEPDASPRTEPAWPLSPWWQLAIVLWAGRRLIGWVVLGSLLGSGGYEWHQGTGRYWQATTRLGVEMQHGHPAAQLLVATLSSADMARAIQLDRRATVRVYGAPVVHIEVVAPTETEAIRAANAIADRALGDDETARVALGAATARQRTEMAAEAGRVRARSATLRTMIDEARQGREVPLSIPALAVIAAWLDDRASALAFGPAAPAIPAGVGLRRIDRAVSATRLPYRFWWTLSEAASGAAVAAMLIVVLMHWARGQRARQRGYDV